MNIIDPKLTRNEKLKIKYRLIMNQYQNATLANKAKHWSEQRLFNELAIKIPKKYSRKVPEQKPKPKTQQQQRYYDRKLQNITYAIQIGMKPKEAKRYSRTRKKKIVSSNEYMQELRKYDDVEDTKTFLTKIKSTYDPDSKNDRVKQWKLWSSNDNKSMPPDIDNLAREINKTAHKIYGFSEPLDEYDRFGYNFVYWLYVNNEDYESVKRAMRPNQFTGGAIYKTARPIGVI